MISWKKYLTCESNVLIFKSNFYKLYLQLKKILIPKVLGLIY